MFLTYRYRVKDGNSSAKRALMAQAHAVNYVWNYCCKIDKEAYRRHKAGSKCRRPTAFDLINLCVGSSILLGIKSDCISAICQKFIKSRNNIFPKTPKFRSNKHSLGWIPFTRLKKCVIFNGDNFILNKRKYSIWYKRKIPDNGIAKSWDLSCDNRGRWYINIAVQITESNKRQIISEIGIDLGLKTLASLSNGEKIEMPAFYRRAQRQLGVFQRRRQKVRVRALHAKIANQRKHFLHVVSTNIVRQHDKIVVGDVSPSKLGKTKMAKSIYDAGWAALRTMLQYKSIATGAVCEIVSERHSSATCSACGARSGPKGIAGLRVREWCCEECGVVHDRDTNASLNILLGAERRPPVAEIPVINAGEDVTRFSPSYSGPQDFLL